MDFGGLRTSTIPGLLVARARTRAARVAFRAKTLGVYRETTWAELAARVAAVADGLAARFGVGRGSTLAIVGDPCPEWGCGANSPQIDSFTFHDLRLLSSEPGKPTRTDVNSQRIAIGAVDGPRTLTLPTTSEEQR